MSANTVKLRGLGERWAAALAALYPGRLPGSLDAKRVAQAWDVSPRTAEAWGEGQTPRLEHLERGFQLHGWGLVEAVLTAGDDARRMETVLRLERDFKRMGTEIERLRAERRGAK